jgi:hypothetical protein
MGTIEFFESWVFLKSIHPSFSLVFAVKCIEIYYYRRVGIIEIEEKGATIGGKKVNTQQR